MYTKSSSCCTYRLRPVYLLMARCHYRATYAQKCFCVSLELWFVWEGCQCFVACIVVLLLVLWLYSGFDHCHCGLYSGVITIIVDCTVV